MNALSLDLYDEERRANIEALQVIEVLGPSLSGRDVSRRVQQYRQAGIPLIGVVDPDRFEVDLYSDGPLRTLTLRGHARSARDSTRLFPASRAGV
jgi:Uma2 family endonuclease